MLGCVYSCEMNRVITTPVAIVLGAVIIALGLYLGLRSKGDRGARLVQTGAGVQTHAPDTGRLGSSLAMQPPGRHPRGRVATTPPRSGAGSVRAGIAVRGDRALKARVTKDATRALEALRSNLVKTCWAPAARKQPQPPKALYLYNMSFSAEGVELGRGISEIRGKSRADVANCLRRQRLGLKIPPPGRVVSVTVPLTLP